jgi:D-lyxose ketol-isomerase
MITRSAYERARQRAAEMIGISGILVRPDELAAIEVADLGLSLPETIGLQILTLASTPAIGVKVLTLWPGQVFAEHRHPALDAYPGKEETFRCQWGELRLFVAQEGAPLPASSAALAALPAERARHFTAGRELRLSPGEQYTVPPHTWHWFAAGPVGAVCWSFSPQATDAQDQFTDPAVVRRTAIVPD